MPIYEYSCNQCEGEFELLVRVGEIPQCPNCAGTALTKHFSVPAAARSAAASSLPICDAPPRLGSGCGLPQCGSGGCQDW